MLLVIVLLGLIAYLVPKDEKNRPGWKRPNRRIPHDEINDTDGGDP